jgi:NADH-quinone oxidoreductase subunit L
LTSIAFLFGWLAISGLPPFAGFFSKDEILWSAVAIPNPIFPVLPEILYFAGLLASFLTAFYMTRLVVMVFFGEYRGSRETFEHLHESPWTMVAPLLVLAAGSLASGWIGVPQSIGGGDSLGKFLEPVFQGSALKTDGIPGRMEPLLMLASLLVAVLGVGAAWYIYGLKHTLSQKIFKLVPGGKKALEKKYYVDELYEVTVVRWVRGFARIISDHLIEKLIVNGLVDGLLSVFQKAARWTGKIQSGLVRAYLAYMLLGAGFLLYWMVH